LKYTDDGVIISHQGTDYSTGGADAAGARDHHRQHHRQRRREGQGPHGQEGEEDLALRIGVRPGGCSGFQYSIYFDDEIADDDEVLETKGVRVLIDAMSVPYIMGSEFDYVDGLMGAGFAVNNPNVQGGCGCGSSFTC
jgi:iron-sulfur cluster assembly accessory protein